MAAIPADAQYVQATWFFKGVGLATGAGWSETLCCPANVTATATALTRAKALAPLRAKLLGDKYQLDYIRVSKMGVWRDSLIDTTVYTGGNVGNKMQTIPEGDFAYSVVLVRMESGDLNRRSFYLSGAPDSIQVIDKVVDDPNWLGNFDTWKQKVIAQWGFLGLKRDPVTNLPLNPKIKKFYNIDNVLVRRMGSHKRGRPFDQLRGRRSNRPQVGP